MKLREYKTTDCEQMAKLFYNTVHSVNAKDYTEEQLNVWAAGSVDLQEWNQSFLKHKTVVAVEDDEIVGFGDIDQSGYLDRLYVHMNYPGMGIASAIYNELARAVLGDLITTHASITAKPFFEHRGYKVALEQEVVRQGIKLKNYVMEKKTSIGFSDECSGGNVQRDLI